MTIFNVISMLGGLSLFLYGMRIMGDGLKKESTGSFKHALEKVTNNPFLGFLIGMGLTAIIQSATATIVIVSGLVGAGVMSLGQSIGVILGANVGTTVTGQIIRLLDVDASANSWLNIFKPNTLAPIAAIIGIVFIMFIKSRKSDTIGIIAMGFGILFTGLITMTAAVAPLSESPEFTGLFLSFGDRPLLGFLIGFAVAFVLQSSSATIGILQALSVTGALTFSGVYPIIAGIYLGDCVTTAIVCSIGTKPDAKRTGVVNILFNLSEIVLITICVNALHAVGALDGIWGSVLNSGGIANTHTVFNLSCAIVLLPLAKTYGKIAEKIIKDEAAPTKVPELQALDDKLFSSPALALNSSYKAILLMNDKVRENLMKVNLLFDHFDDAVFEQIVEDEDLMDMIADEVSNYLARMSSSLQPGLQEKIQNYYLQCITDFERAGDHIYETAKCAKDAFEKELSFSSIARDDLSRVAHLLAQTVDSMGLGFAKQNLESAADVQPCCETISAMCDRARDGHLDRIRRGECDSETGFVYLDVLMHLSRVSDMCSNIALHTLARHTGDAGFEHAYVAALRRGESEKYNSRLKELSEEYLK